MARQKMSLHRRILLGSLLAAAAATGGVRAQVDDDGCLLLTGSKACRGFSQYYVGITDLASAYPFISNVSDVSSFDSNIYSYIASTSIAQQIGCSEDTQYIRYSLTHLCANLIHESTGSLPCNFRSNLIPSPMCRSSCADWIASISTTIAASDNATCASGLSVLESECDWPGFNGAVGSCVLGSDNEPDNCGFQDNRSGACEYCQTTNGTSDACCSSLSCNNNNGSLSGGAIAGIVIVCVVGLAVAVLGFLFWRRRRRTARPPRFAPIFGRLHRGDDPHANLVTTVPTGGAIEEKTQIPSNTPVALDEVFCEAVHEYQPQVEDELDLRKKDIVYLIFQLDDGWGYGYNVTTGQMGVFPLLCVVQVKDELLEQLLHMPASPDKIETNNEKTLAEEEDQGLMETHGSGTSAMLAARIQEIRETARRSISITSLKRISQMPRHAPPVWIQHHQTMPTRRVSSPHEQQSSPLSSAPPLSRRSPFDSTPSSPTSLFARGRTHPPPPTPAHTFGESYEMHNTTYS